MTQKTPERKALVFNVQKYNTYDGPGVRTLIFFKGCPLRCQWCANPEGLERKVEIMHKAANCNQNGACVPACPQGIHYLNDQGKHQINRSIPCIGCGNCVEACTTNANTVVGEYKTISELLEIIEEDRMFYDMSGGGVTLGGGECTAQPEAVTSLLAACKQVGIHTAIETSGYTPREHLKKIAQVCDLFLFDIKHMDPKQHIHWTGVNNELILSNVVWLLQNDYNVNIRMPLLKGVNHDDEEIRRRIEFLLPYKDYKNFKGVDLLPYHKMGVGKYAQMDRPYPMDSHPDPKLSSEELEHIRNQFEAAGIPVKLIMH